MPAVTRIEDRHPPPGHPSIPHRAPGPSSSPKKSLFNKIVGEANAGGLELSFAAFLEAAPDVQAFAKNYLAVGFKLDYVRADGDLSNYIPDFIVRTRDGDGLDRGNQGPRRTRPAPEDGPAEAVVRRRHRR